MEPNQPKRGNPNMKPGAPSVNPSGRPKGAAGLARYVAEQTRDGQELVDRLLSIARSDKSTREAAAACAVLLDRMAGKPLASHELNVNANTAEPTRSYGHLSLERRRELLLEIRGDDKPDEAA